MPRSNRKNASSAARHGSALTRMASEIPAATLTTLAFRLPMLWWAMADPKAASDPELSRMVTEKLDGAGRSARAIAKGGEATVSALGRHGARQLRSMAPVKSALTSPDPAAALRALVQQGTLTAKLAAALAVEIGAIGTRTASSAVAPLHGRVTANARRLSARKPDVR